MKNIALITILFDYPLHYSPSFKKNALSYFSEEDIHIIRHSGLVKEGSYYDKLSFYKINKLLEYLENYILDEYEFILFLDATDTNFLKSPSYFINDLKSLNCSIVFGAEKGLWPNTNYTHLYHNKRVISDSKYLNSGTYFGHTDKVIYHLREIIKNDYQKGIDDQGLWTIQYLLNDDIIIDQERNFFFSTLDSKDDIKITNKKIELLNSNACIIHDNGPYNDNTLKLTNFLNENN